MKFRIGRNDFLKALSKTGMFSGQCRSILKTGDGILSLDVHYENFSVSASAKAETEGTDEIAMDIHALRNVVELAGHAENLTFETDEKKNAAIIFSETTKAVLDMHKPFGDEGGDDDGDDDLALWRAVFESGSFAKALSACLVRPIRYDTIPVKVARCGNGTYATGTNGMVISRMPIRTIEADDGMGFNIPCCIIPALVSFLEGEDTVGVTDSGCGISIRGRNSTFRFEINGCNDFPDIGRYFDKERYSPSNPDICAIDLPRNGLLELIGTMTGPDGKRKALVEFRMERKVLTVSTGSLPGIRIFSTGFPYVRNFSYIRPEDPEKAPDFRILLRASYLRTILENFCDRNDICTFIFRPDGDEYVKEPLVILSDGDWENDDGVHVMAVLCK